MEEKKEIINRMIEEESEGGSRGFQYREEGLEKNKSSLIRSFAVNRESYVGVSVPISNELGDEMEDMIMDSFRDRYEETETNNPEEKLESRESTVSIVHEPIEMTTISSLR